MQKSLREIVSRAMARRAGRSSFTPARIEGFGSVVAAWAMALVAGCSSPSNRAVAEDLPSPDAPPPSKAAEPASTLPNTGTVEPSEPAARGTDDVARAGDVPPRSTDDSSLDATSDDTVAPADRSVAWPRSVDGSASEALVATVGGRPVPLTELVAKWIMRDPVGVRGILDDLILSRIVTYEAAALGVALPDGAVEEEVRLRARELEAASRKAGAPTLEAYVKSRLGLDMDALSTELAAEATVDLLAPRCIRAWILGMDRREIRAIALDDRSGVDEVQARLARGDDFADVARALSKDPSATEGGRMPPVVRGEQALAQAAFSTDVGTITGPIQDDRGFVFLKVESRPDLVEGTWDEIGEKVEASLTDRPVEDPEFWQWKEAMFRRYEIDISPFLELAGR